MVFEASSYQTTQEGFEASEQRSSAEFSQNLKLQRDGLMQSIRAFEAQDARDSENMRFLLRKQQVAVEEGNRSALQQAFALQEQISSRIESTRMQRQQMVTNVQTLNAQMASEAARFNSQQQMQADQINESRRQSNLEQRRGVARDIAEFSANPGDVGKLASFLRAGGATGITQAMAAGESAVTDESLLPLQLLLGTRNELDGGPSLVEADLVDAPELDIPEFGELSDVPDVEELWDEIGWDDSDIVRDYDIGEGPNPYEDADAIYGPNYDQYDADSDTASDPDAVPPPDLGPIVKPEGSGSPSIAELDALPIGGQIESDGTTYTNRGSENQALSAVSADDIEGIPDWVKEGVGLSDDLGLAEGGVGVFSKPSKVNVAEEGPEMVIGVPLGDQRGKKAGSGNGNVSGIGAGVGSFADGGRGSSEFQRQQKRPKFDLNASLEPGPKLADRAEAPLLRSEVRPSPERLIPFGETQPGNQADRIRQRLREQFAELKRRPRGRASRDGGFGRFGTMENLVAAARAEQSGQVTTSMGMATRLLNDLRSGRGKRPDRPRGGDSASGRLGEVGRSSGDSGGGERRRRRRERFARMSPDQQARVRRAWAQRQGRGRSGGRRQDGRRRRSGSGVGQGDLSRVFERPEVRDVFSRLDPQVRRSLTEALAQSGGGSSGTRGGGRGVRRRGSGDARQRALLGRGDVRGQGRGSGRRGGRGQGQRLGLEEGGVGLFNRSTSVNVAEAGPEAIIRAPVGDAAKYQEQVYLDALRKSGFDSAPTPVGLSAPGTSRFVQELGAGVAGTRGFSKGAYFEELEKARPQSVRGGISRRTG